MALEDTTFKRKTRPTNHSPRRQQHINTRKRCEICSKLTLKTPGHMSLLFLKYSQVDFEYAFVY